jgi:hypothetical protein
MTFPTMVGAALVIPIPPSEEKKFGSLPPFWIVKP